MADIDEFEEKLKQRKGTVLDSDSSSEEEAVQIPQSKHANELTKLQSQVQASIQTLLNKKKQLESVKKLVESSEPSSEDPKFRRILRLAKENRAFQVALESEKTRISRLNEEIEYINDQNLSAGSSKELSDEDFKEKAAYYEEMCGELEAKYGKIKEELRQSKTTLKKEVGEFESLDSIKEGWRERAQELEKLRGTVNDLKRQLNFNPNLKRQGTAQNRQNEIFRLSEVILSLQAEAETWEKKAKSAVSKKNMLERDLSEMRDSHKSRIKALLDKTEVDDQYISELKAEIERLKTLPDSNAPVPQDFELNNANWQISSLNQEANALEEELKEKNSIVELFNVKPNESLIKNEDDYKNKIKQLESQLRKTRPGNDDDSRIIKDLNAHNERLKIRVNQLTEELSKLKQ